LEFKSGELKWRRHIFYKHIFYFLSQDGIYFCTRSFFLKTQREKYVLLGVTLQGRKAGKMRELGSLVRMND
jgi:hypothetical protein